MNTRLLSQTIAILTAALFVVFLAADADARGRDGGGRGGGGGYSRSGPAAGGSLSSRGASGASARTASGQAGSAQRSATRQNLSSDRSDTRQSRTETRGDTRTSGQEERTERVGERQDGRSERTEDRTNAARDIADDWDDHHGCCWDGSGGGGRLRRGSGLHAGLCHGPTLLPDFGDRERDILLPVRGDLVQPHLCQRQPVLCRGGRSSGLLKGV